MTFQESYQGSGLEPTPLPHVPGGEGAGVVEQLGEGVTRFVVGDRVGYAGGFGTYADYRAMPAGRAVRLPDAISSETAAGAMLKVITAG